MNRLNRTDYILRTTKYTILFIVALLAIFFVSFAGVYSLDQLYGEDPISQIKDYYNSMGIVAFALVGIVILTYVLFIIKASIKRLHDLDFSGWWVISYYIPYIGTLVCIFLLFYPGLKSKNRFGKVPAKPSETRALIAGICSTIFCYSWLFTLIKLMKNYIMSLN